MVITETLKRRFVKDMNLPIKVFAEPAFSHFLELYEEHFGASTLYAEFLQEISKYNCEQDYLREYNRIKDEAINYLANNTAMQHFSQEEDMNRFGIVNRGLPANCVFKETMVGRYLLSIDMRKANFTALRHYNPDILGGKNSYEDFIGMFTDSEYIKKSKYIRQVIFGNQNPKRQTRYEQYLMDLVLTRIYGSTNLRENHVVYFGTDEIVFDVTDFVTDGVVDALLAEKIADVLSWASDNQIHIRAEYYHLYRIRGTNGYLKKFISPTNGKTVEIKSADGLELPFIIRKLKNELPEEMDFYFCFEGKMAKLLEPIEPVFATESIC